MVYPENKLNFYRFEFIVVVHFIRYKNLNNIFIQLSSLRTYSSFIRPTVLGFSPRPFLHRSHQVTSLTGLLLSCQGQTTRLLSLGYPEDSGCFYGDFLWRDGTRT